MNNFMPQRDMHAQQQVMKFETQENVLVVQCPLFCLLRTTTKRENI